MTDQDFAALDTFSGVVRGARSFRLNADGMLTGIVYRQVWTTGENFAICRKFDTFLSKSQLQFEQHSPEDTRYRVAPTDTMMECRHGFYAYCDGNSDFPTTNAIRAMIEGYGEVVIGSRGFRAMKAKIVALQTIDKDSLTAVCQNYPNIPLFNTFEHMMAEYPPEFPDKKGS
jgi:hypothetical protein